MDAWVWWTIVAVALAIAEVLTLTFVLGMLAGGAAAAAIAAAVGAPSVWQYVVFGVVDAALLGGLLPIARRHRHTPPSIRTGTERLIGTRAMTLTELTTVAGGRVRIEGETWSARPYTDAAIPAGEWVEVLKIDGTYAVVQPAAQSPS
ncbi:MAG TPA: NfeD family protein [Mycobacteriales bacterium]|nr:NfeD family protein [Mycobacteriales bacterium]